MLASVTIHRDRESSATRVSPSPSGTAEKPATVTASTTMTWPSLVNSKSPPATRPIP